MKTFKYIFISLITLYSIQEATSQSNCDLEQVVPVNEAASEVNDTLPDIPPPVELGGSRSQSGNRMLYFIHGLNGKDKNSWERAHTASMLGVFNDNINFPAREVSSYMPNYDSDIELETAVTIVHQLMAVNQYDVPSDYFLADGIAIGHSQGGIVGRAIDQYYSERNTSGELLHSDIRRFGGLVTLATPNQGAQILNNKEFIQGFVYDLADNLTVGPITEFTSSSNFFVRLMAKLINLGELRAEFVNFIGNDFGSYLIAENMPKITKAYTVPMEDGGAESRIINLNEYEPIYLDEEENEEHTSLVAFYAVADLVKTYYNVGPIN
ncbi:MAG: hypothetical protein EA409_13865, partial [Saprospirales bacterium]